MESDGGGLHEPDHVAPDLNVPGSWVAGAFSKAVNGIEPIERAEMAYLSNPEWAKRDIICRCWLLGNCMTTLR